MFQAIIYMKNGVFFRCKTKRKSSSTEGRTKREGQRPRNGMVDDVFMMRSGKKKKFFLRSEINSSQNTILFGQMTASQRKIASKYQMYEHFDVS